MGSFSALLIDSVPPKTVGLLSTNGKAVCQMTATEETISVGVAVYYSLQGGYRCKVVDEIL